MTGTVRQIGLQDLRVAERVELSDRSAQFADLVVRQSPFVFRVAFALLRNRQDAEDVVQETFLKLYRLGSWDQIQNEKAFLASAAWRIGLERLPRRVHIEVDEKLSAQGANPEEAAIGSDSRALVHRLVDALPEELRQPLALSTVEEMSSKEIGELMGIAEGTVRTRLMRARQMLKDKLKSLLETRYEKR